MTKPPKRQPSLNRLLEDFGAQIWLSDADGKFAYLSPAMAELLGEARLSPDRIEQTQAALACPGNLTRHGHRTVTLTIPGVPSASTADHINTTPLRCTVHFVRLSEWTLGAVDAFVSDDQWSIDQCHGEEGIRELTQVDQLISHYRATVGRFAGILLSGESTATKQLRGRFSLACKVHDHVGLFGPTGCGSELIAKQIHYNSTPNETLVNLDASLMDQELLQAYAGPAVGELTDDGQVTLLLQRINEMPSDGQQQLLQWMQTWPDRLRVIGLASPTDTDKVQAGQTDWIPDLHAALSIMSLTLPPLSSRGEDLKLFVRGLIQEHYTNTKKPSKAPEMSREFFDLVATYPWPGQWDELHAAMRFACEAVKGDRLLREHLPLAVRSYQNASNPAVEIHASSGRSFQVRPAAASGFPLGNQTLDEAVADFERQLIEQAVQQSGGNKAEAARKLGISRARLLRKLGDSS